MRNNNVFWRLLSRSDQTAARLRNVPSMTRDSRTPHRDKASTFAAEIAPVLSALVSDRRDNVAWQRLSGLIWPLVLTTHTIFGLSSTAEEAHAEVLTRLLIHTDFSVFHSGVGFKSYVWAIVRTLRGSENEAMRIGSLDPSQLPSSSFSDPFDNLIFRELLGALLEHFTEEEQALVGILIESPLGRDDLAAELEISSNAFSVRVCRLKERILIVLEKTN